MTRTVTYDETKFAIVPIEPTLDMVFATTHINNSLDHDDLFPMLRDAIKAAPPYPESNFVESLDSWIPCSERLPAPYTEVMVWPYPTDYCMTAEIDHTKTWAYNEYVSNYGNERTFAYRITHWMPLPAAPKGEE